MRGRVVLVGGGPGDPDLLTVRAAREIARAEVLLYDALIDPALLELAPPDCERVDVGKRGDGSRGVSLDDIAGLMIAHAREGRYVVRLKGGDPFVFGRGGEEASALVEAGIPFEVVPGVTSAIAVPTYAGIPLTDRRFSSSFAVVTGHRGKSSYDHQIDWEGLALRAETLVVLMGTTWLPDIARRVIEGGRDPETPAAVIERGTGPHHRVVVAPLRELADRAKEAGLAAPTVIVIGEVVRLREKLAWYEARPLFARRVLVTRELDQARDLIGLLRRQGADPISVPLLAFAPPKDAGPLDRGLEKLDRYDWLVFTSANAVRAVACRLRELGRGPGIAPGVRVACVGPKTQQAAVRAGMAVDVVPARRSIPEELGQEMSRLENLTGARILFPRARSGREELAEALRASGAEVDIVEAYRTVRPEAAERQLRVAMEAGLDAVTLLSPSAVSHLADLLGRDGFRGLAERAVLACIGPTTAGAVRDHGVEPPLVSEIPSAEALVEALELHFGRRNHVVSS